MSKDKRLKAALICLSGALGAVGTQEFFSGWVKAAAAVLGGGVTALLAYLLNPNSPPEPPK